MGSSRIKAVAVGLGLLALLAARPALAFRQVGNESIVDFEEWAVATAVVVYPYLGQSPPGLVISGGTVEDGGAQFPAQSGIKVYVASWDPESQTYAIDTAGSIDFVTDWLRIGAWVTSTSAPVTATFSPVGMTLSAGGGTQYLSLSDPYAYADDLVTVSFASSAPFAIDDLTFGCPDCLVGVPEPGPWTMVLTGFMGVGAGVRRRLARSARSSPPTARSA